MRILLVAGAYPPEPCGVGDYTEKLARALADLDGLQVGVITKAAPRRRDATVRANIIGEVERWSFPELLNLASIIRKWSPELVHIQYPSQGYNLRIASIIALIAKSNRMKVVSTLHEPLINNIFPIRGFIYTWILARGSDGVIAVRPNLTDLLPVEVRKLIQDIPQMTIGNASPLPLSSLGLDARARLRAKLTNGRERLIVFFGFVHAAKGIDQLFDIADPRKDSLVIAGAAKDETYVAELHTLASSKGWCADQVQITGFRPAQEVADLLAVADAVVLPFVGGGGDWNTSIHAALSQGAFVVTTAKDPKGYESDRNLYTAKPLDVGGMQRALDDHAGRHVLPVSPESQWNAIAAAHRDFYRSIRSSSGGCRP